MLRAADLPRGLFTTFTNGRVTRADGPRPHAGDDWRVAFKRRGATTRTATTLLVTSRVDVFADAAAAHRDLAARRLGGSPAFEESRFGQETRGAALRQRVGGRTARYYTIAWRQGPITAVVRVSGFSESSAADAVGLARRQQERIVRATAGTRDRR